MRLTKLPAVRKLVVLRLEDDRDDDQADDDRQRAELAGADAGPPAPRVVAERLVGRVGDADGRRVRRVDGACGRAHAVTSVSTAPGTFDSCAGGDRLDDLVLGGLRALELGDVLAEAQDRDRSATSKTSCMLCEMRTTREALLGQALDEVEHLRASARRRARRSARRGSRRLRVPHARPWRPRPTGAGRRRGWRRSGAPSWIVRHRQRRRASPRARFSIVASSRRRSDVELLAAEEHVLDDVEVVAQREVLVDDLDAERARRPSGRGC